MIPIKRFRSDERGVATYVFFISIITILVFTCAFIMERSYAVLRQNIITDAVNFSVLATYRDVDRVELARGRTVLNETAARVTFEQFLRENLRLNASLTSLDPENDLVGGQVRILEFAVYNPDDLHAICSLGTPITHTAVHAVVIVPIRQLFGAGAPIVELTIHMDTDIILDLS